MYYVYIIKCHDTSFYTGITTDIERRILEHNGQLPGGARYTLGRRPVVLMYVQKYRNRSLASKEESRIKKLSRSEKEKLMNIDK